MNPAMELVNEWIAAVFLDYLEIARPKTAFIELTPDFIESNPECRIDRGGSKGPPVPGWHFGSLFPGDPNRQAVYDFLPDVLLDSVANHAHFRGALVFALVDAQRHGRTRALQRRLRFRLDLNLGLARATGHRRSPLLEFGCDPIARLDDKRNGFALRWWSFTWTIAREARRS